MMFTFSYCMTYVVHMGHYNAYTFTLVSSMCGHVLFTFDMYFIEVSNRVNSSLSFLLITKIRSFINQLPIIITIIYHKWDIFWLFQKHIAVKHSYMRQFLHKRQIGQYVIFMFNGKVQIHMHNNFLMFQDNLMYFLLFCLI